METPNLTKLAYQTLQQGKSIAGIAHKELSSKLMELIAPDAIPNTEPLTIELLNDLRSSIETLEKLDLLEAEQGLYPVNQLFDTPWLEWAARYPLLWFDLPSTWRRRERKYFLRHNIC